MNIGRRGGLGKGRGREKNIGTEDRLGRRGEEGGMREDEQRRRRGR